MEQNAWNRFYPAGALASYREEPGSPVTLFTRSASRYPERNCLSFGSLTLSYAQTLDLVQRAAAGLQAHGLCKGDRIALLLPNHPGFVIGYYAALQIGAVAVAINPLYPTLMIATQLRNSGARVLVVADIPGLLDTASACLEQSLVESVIVVRMDASDLLPGADTPAPTLAPRMVSLASILADAGHPQAVAIDPLEDLAALQATGGTTGTPKFAMLTHNNFWINTQQARLMMSGLREGREVFLVPLPLFHITGTTLLMHLGLAVAAELVLMPKFDIGAAITLCIERGVTNLAAVPTIYTAFLDHPDADKVNWRGMTQVMAGGGPLPPETGVRFMERFGVRIRQGYGLSECSPGLTMVPDCAEGSTNSIGIPIPGTQIQIRDPADPARVLPAGEAGEICAAGPQVMKGYWNRPEETQAVMTADGFLRTGDIGKMDANGFIEIVDRLKDVIIASGYKLFPTAIEAAVCEHPAVSEVAVIGIPDPYRGETAKAFYSLRPGATLDIDELRIFLTSRLSPMEMPKLFEMREVLPKTAAGKISRLALREEERERAG